MATPEQYAEWIVNNQDKKGTPEFNTVAEAYKLSKGKGETLPPAPPEDPVSPTDDMNFGENALAGIGKSFVDTYQGLQQIGGQIGNKVGLVSDERLGALQQDIDQRKQLDAPLMETGGGIVGNIAGQAAQFALPAGALGKVPAIAGLAKSKVAQYALAAAGGGAFGASQPVATDDSRVTNTALGAAGGVAGQAVADVVPAVARKWGAKALTKAATKNTQSAQKFAVAKDANKLGYVIPPADINPRATTELASGISGKIKTAQVASQRNQAVTDTLAKRALGLSDDAQLDLPTLSAIRKQAGDAYEVVSSVGIVNPSPKYTQALDDAVKPFSSASRSFPNRTVPAVVKDIDSLKTAAFDAGDAVETIKLLRDDADKAYRAGDKAVGKAYKSAADALEQAIDDHLVTTKAPTNILDNYRNARKVIAKTYTVEGALNPTTGNIDASKLASALNRKKPLEGELLEIAKISQAFPKATQMLKETPKAVSPLDYAVGGIGSVSTGNVLPLAMVGARPALRNVLLSKVAQKSAINNSAFKPSTLSQVAPRLTDNNLFKGGAVPVGVALGLQGSP